MAAITLEIHGLATLSTDGRANTLGGIVNVPNVTAAKLDPSKMVPSDQTATFEISATPQIRAALLTAGARLGQLSRPLGFYEPDHPDGGEVVYCTNAGSVSQQPFVWLGAERLEILGRLPDFSGVRVARATRNTRRDRYSMPPNNSDEFAGGRWLYSRAPLTLAGLRATYRFHGDDGTDEVLFRGVLTEVYDSGDQIQLTVKTDLQRIGEQTHHDVRALYPFNNDPYLPAAGTEDDYYSAQRGQLTSNASGFAWSSGDPREILFRFRVLKGPGVPPERIDRWGYSRALLSTGHPAQAGFTFPPWPSSWPRDQFQQVPQPYRWSAIHPFEYHDVRAIAVRGADGVRVGATRASSGSIGLSDDEYAFFEVTIVNEGYELGEYQYGIYGDTANTYGFGPQGVRRGNVNDLPWVLRSVQNGVRQNTQEVATQFPTTISIGKISLLPTSASGQPFAAQRGWGLVPADAIDSPTDAINATVSGVASGLVTWGGGAGSLAVFSELRSLEPLRQGRYAWPIEQWLGRAVKDTYFGDLRAALAIIHAAGPEGTLRPVRLARDFPTTSVHKINVETIRDRDHTIDLTPSLAIERVTLQGLPPAVTLPRQFWDDSSGSREAAPFPESVEIVSAHAADEGLEGASISIKKTPYLNRAPATVFATTLEQQNAPAGGLPAIARACWERAVRSYGRPFPRCTLVVDRQLVRAFPGDFVEISLPNMPNSTGGLGVERMIGQVWERGDNVERGTSELDVLLVGWDMSVEEPFDPSSLQPLIWLDPSDVATLFVDSAGTTPVLFSGDPVGLWRNKGTLGSDGDAAQPVSASRPTWTDAGGGAMAFESNQTMTTGHVAAMPFSAAVGWRRSPSMTGAGHMLTTGGAGIQRWNINSQIGDGVQAIGPSARTATVSDHEGAAYAAWSTGSLKVRTLENQNENSTTVAPFTPQPTRIGLSYTGDVGHVLVFDRELTEEESTKLLSWMEAKHGI